MDILVGNKAPVFKSQAVVNKQIVEDFSLTQYEGKFVLFFFYPLNFTFVCPTELHAFQEKLPEFESRNAKVVACSVDSPFSHLAWLNTPKAKGGIEGIHYPLVSDLNKNISKAYQVLVPDAGVSYRGLFLIDQEGIIRHQIVNDLPLGRSVNEALRMLDSLIFHQQNGEVCPANWQVGKEAMTADHQGLEKYFSK